MSTPLVSICLPNLNTFPFLEERLQTILAQTIKDWELIVCDSYSDDGSWEYFQQLNDDPRVTLFQAPRKGAPGSWNYCLERAKGEYIYIATSDDTMSPDCLEKLLQPMEAHSHIGLAACDFEAIDEKGRLLTELHRPMTFIEDWTGTPCIRHGASEFLLHACFGPTWVTMTSVLFRRLLLRSTGPFPSHLGPIGDTAWAMRANLATDTAFVPGRLATWRRRRDQASHPIVNRRDFREMLDCVRSVTYDREIEVPDHWKAIPGWRAAITSVWFREYCHTFSLYRRSMREDPLGFLGNFFAALINDPRCITTQFSRGFVFPAPGSFDRIETARELIEQFQTPWPPTAVPTDWSRL